MINGATRATSIDRRERHDTGSGVLSTTLGVGVFLIFLLLAAHVLLNLWVRSTIDSVALDAAMDVALAEDHDRAAAEARALDDARVSLGSYSDRVLLAFEHAAGEEDLVVLRVNSEGLDLLPPMGSALDRLGELDSRIVVHRESRR